MVGVNGSAAYQEGELFFASLKQPDGNYSKHLCRRGKRRSNYSPLVPVVPGVWSGDPIFGLPGLLDPRLSGEVLFPMEISACGGAALAAEATGLLPAEVTVVTFLCR